MFNNCSNLKTLDLTNFNTDQVTTMTNMFAGCSSIEELDLRSFDTSNVTQMIATFYGCTSMKEIKVSEKWTTENVTSTTHMFLSCGVKEVTVY